MDLDTPEDKDVSSTQQEGVVLENDVEIIDESNSCTEPSIPVSLPQQPVAIVDGNQPDLVFDALNKKTDDLPSDCARDSVTPFIGPVRPAEYENETNLNVETINSDGISTENNKVQANLNTETINNDSISTENYKFETNSNSNMTIVEEINVLNIHQETTEVDNADERINNIVADNDTDVENMEITPSENINNDNGFNKVPKAYDFSSFVQIAKVEKPYLSEGNFLKGCKWSPDGTQLLACSEDSHLRVFKFPSCLYNGGLGDKMPELGKESDAFEGGLIYDYAWYPKMESSDPLSCCYLSTSSGAPVHLRNSNTGELESTYIGYDYAFEVTAARSVCFDLSGEKIYCGYKNFVKVFTTDKPGDQSVMYNLKKLSSQSGIISCITMNPQINNVWAAGSYRRTIGLYTNDGQFLCLLKGSKSGITHMKFSHDGWRLYTGNRKDNELLCWDLRKPGRVLCSLNRNVQTSQRIYFDITPCDRYLVSGNTDGYVKVWDVKTCTSSAEESVVGTFLAHNTCTNGVSVHPKLPVLATASGQWESPELISDEEENRLFQYPVNKRESCNSVKLWKIG